ncbi:hypothetical protein P4N68_07470 [Corynebacterium felinum]|uniref:Cell division protein FtsL n=1 Tax=Corynebacterium felinum TaxID=131318 RepID=A0ABU2BEI9_9CORY|nr:MULTISPECIES: hypothetical protein [Corynebacterium]MDF5820915.1 hypothetical protein [Corynebacterium felinum]MDO4761443.1 hypothetical protein [Corynebacterium sp.]MDR7356143.1 hypothetical protein [Corynebacterium felinum]WJY95477.1 hypothetical protein CFELI_09365 [Corynebacterium felinum]
MNTTQLPRTYSSRDYSGDLDRNTTHRSSVIDATRTLPSPERARTATPTRRTVAAPKRRFQHKGGSKQQFTYRGRRVERPKADRGKIRFTIFISIIVMLGVCAATLLSGVSTDQSFKISTLKHNEQMLRNQLETLNRDLQQASATAEIARRAQEMGMVVPDQPGILVRNENGDIVEQRPATDATRPIVDVNGQQIRPRLVTSDPKLTQEVAPNLNPVPQVVPMVPNVAPYPANH